MSHLNTYRVINPRVDPYTFNRLKVGYHQGVVQPDGAVLVGSIVFRFETEPPFVAGTPVVFWVQDRHWTVADAQEKARYDIEARAEYERAMADAREASRQLRRRWRVEAEAFNAALRVPVKWDVGYKDVLSGLSAKSRGDGRRSSTVNHIVLLEPLQVGRLKGGVNDFLCTTKSGSNGKQWSGGFVPAEITDGDGIRYRDKVECKACLRIAERF